MTYQFVQPCPALRPYVEEFILMTPSTGSTRPEQIPPGGKSGISLNLGADYQVDLAGVSQRLPLVSVGGQLTTLLTLSKPADGQVLLINCRPTDLHRLFGWPMHELTNRFVPIDDLLAARARQSWDALAGQLMDVTNTQERIRCVEKHLLTYANWLPRARTNWIDTAALWLSQPGDCRIQHLLSTIQISPRQLSRAFGQQVGLTPKGYAQVMRFRNVYRAALAPTCPPWQDLVHAGGWYDQAHFCNDLYRLTGQTPTAFFAHRHAIAEMMIEPVLHP